MKPRSTVRALLAVTEFLLAARTKPRAKTATSRVALRDSKAIDKLFGKGRSLLLKPRVVS